MKPIKIPFAGSKKIYTSRPSSDRFVTSLDTSYSYSPSAISFIEDGTIGSSTSSNLDGPTGPIGLEGLDQLVHEDSKALQVQLVILVQQAISVIKVLQV